MLHVDTKIVLVG